MWSLTLSRSVNTKHIKAVNESICISTDLNLGSDDQANKGLHVLWTNASLKKGSNRKALETRCLLIMLVHITYTFTFSSSVLFSSHLSSYIDTSTKYTLIPAMLLMHHLWHWLSSNSCPFKPHQTNCSQKLHIATEGQMLRLSHKLQNPSFVENG